MDFSCDSETIVPILISVLLLYASFRIISKEKRTNRNYSLPEPRGSLPVIGHLHLLGRREPVVRILGAMSDQLGPIYSLRLGQHRTLVLSSWEHVKECLTTHDRLFANRPTVAVGKHIGYDSAVFALAPYGQYWRHIRKLATLHLLSGHRVKSLQSVVVPEVDSFVSALALLSARGGSQPLPLSELLEELTLGVNARLIAGKRLAAGEDRGVARRFKAAVKEALYLAGVFVWSDAIPWLEFLDIHGHVSSMKRVFKELDAVLENWLDEHRRARARDSDGSAYVDRDLMDAMLSNIAEDDAIISSYSRDTVVKATALILMLTGTESTSVTLTWAISLLVNNPSVLKTAQQELDAHVGQDRWVQHSDMDNLKFLEAILKETLRLNPPGPITGPREATEDCHVGGYHVPKGMRLVVNIWQLQRDPRVWPDPAEFRPERFLTGQAGVSLRGGENLEYIPFSSGRRSCPGAGLGLLVVQLVLARLVQGFHMETVDCKPVDMREGLGIALPKLEPLHLVLSHRLPMHLYECL